VSVGDNAATVAGKVRTAIDADAKFDVGTLTDATFTAISKDLKSVTDFNAGDSGFTMSVTTQGADIGAGPTGAIWASIAAGKKVLVDISGATDAASVATLVETAFDALTGATTKMVTAKSTGDIKFTREKPAVVAADVPKSTDDSGAGSITSVQTTAGVASGFAPGTDVITTAAHGMTTGQKLALTINSGSLPTGLSASDYYAIVTGTTTFQLASSLANAIAGTAVDFTDYGDAGKTATFTPATLSIVPVLWKSNDKVNWAIVTTESAITSSSTVMHSYNSVAYPYIKVIATPSAGACTFNAQLAATTYLN